MAVERKVLTDLVASAGGAEEAFVQKEFFSDEFDETRLKAHPGFEFTEALPVPLTTGESNMRLVGASLVGEPATLRRGGDPLVQDQQFGRDLDAGKECPCSIEESQSLKLNGNGRQMHLAQSRHNALVVLSVGIAQKLQSDVPGFRRRPAKPVPVGSEP
jgi:hypothetical protein